MSPTNSFSESLEKPCEELAISPESKGFEPVSFVLDLERPDLGEPGPGAIRNTGHGPGDGSRDDEDDDDEEPGEVSPANSQPRSRYNEPSSVFVAVVAIAPLSICC